MKKLLGIVVLSLLWCNISLTDEKPGRFFEDQPDVTGKASDVWVNKNTTYIFTSDSRSTFKNLIFNMAKSQQLKL